MALLDIPDGPTAAAPPATRRQHWRSKFRVAFRGFKLGVRGQSSFFVHFFFAAFVLAAALVLGCNQVEWCLLLGCIGLVLTAELFNSCIETLFRAFDEPTQAKGWPCLDIAAAAVLMASITASAVGILLFLPKLAAWLGLL